MSAVYAYKNVDTEVMNSSSGGAFIALCEAFEQLHGADHAVFYGAVLDEQCTVRHMRADSAEACHIFQGSKYVRSDCSCVFDDLASQLQKGKKVLFSGTPCQLYALKAFLKKNGLSEEQVLMVDVICHGAPKKEYWDDYRHWLEQKAGGRLVRYSFRYKPEGWKAYPAYAEFDNGKVIINTAETSVFSRMHMARYSMAKGCFSCPFAKEERISDITLGDYWGVEKEFSDIPYKTGVSLVLVHTEQGEQLLTKLDRNGIYLKETKSKAYLQYQHNLNRPTEMPERYEEFWQDYEKIGFEGTLKKYLGYGAKYRILYQIKKMVRKTPLIEVYRNRKR